MDSIIKKLPPKSFFPLVGAFILLTTLAIMGAAFLVTSESSPYTSELAFIEHSSEDGIIGSMVPASCESNPPTNHFAGDCQCSLGETVCSGVTTCTKTINWNTNTGTINLFQDGTSLGNYPQNGSQGILIPPGGSVFSLRRADGTVLCDRFVSGAPAPTLSLTATPNPVDAFNPTTLNWVVTNAYSCLASGGWSGTKSNIGSSEAVNPVTATNYDLVCYGPGGSASDNVVVSINPPVVNLTSSPSHINPGASTNLTWTVSGADSCTASGGVGWFGSKAVAGGTESYSPSSNTTYSLTCTGPGGVTTDTETVLVPTGNITASPCVIPVGLGSCNSTVVWTANDFLGTPSVLQGSTQFSTAVSGSVARAVSYIDKTFFLRDGGGTFERTADSSVTCAPTSRWNGTICLLLPKITMDTIPNPAIIRSGETADIGITIDANYDLTCTMTGAIIGSFHHSPGIHSYPFTTPVLTSAQDARVECVADLWPMIDGSEQVRINVVPAVQEF